MSNILGEVFKDYVRQQIINRQSLLGQKSYSNNDLQVINTKAPFLRLISSVDVGEHFLTTTTVTEPPPAATGFTINEPVPTGLGSTGMLPPPSPPDADGDGNVTTEEQILYDADVEDYLNGTLIGIGGTDIETRVNTGLTIGDDILESAFPTINPEPVNITITNTSDDGTTTSTVTSVTEEERNEGPFPDLTENITITSVNNVTKATNIMQIEAYTGAITQTTTTPTKEGTVLQKLLDLGISEDFIKGDSLAKNLILHGGTSNQSGIRSGLNSTNGAYGWGGIDERGYVPMPGITDASVKFYNNGALSEATINIKCFSRNQFALIDALYLRPGYTLLLEFGHSVYINNSGNKEEMDDFLSPAADALLAGNKTQFQIYDLIEDERETRDGNYDAVYGKITKFNWSFNKDGSYDCTVNLIGLGSIIESLKLNSGPLLSTNSSLDKLYKFYQQTNQVAVAVNEAAGEVEPEGVQAEANVLGVKSPTLLHFYMFLVQTSAPETISASPSQVAGAGGTNLSVKEGGLTTAERTAQAEAAAANIGDKLVAGQFSTQVRDFKLYDVDLNQDGKSGTATIKDALLYVSGVTAPVDEGINGVQSYIKFGCIISIINRKMMFYDGESNATPFTKIDMNFGNGGQPFNKDKNYMLSVPGQLSGNPKVCIIPYSNLQDVDGFPDLHTTELNKVVRDMNTGFKVSGEKYVGRIANILVNTEHVGRCLNNSANSDGDIMALDFLQNLLGDINNALGGVNNFKVEIDDEGLIKIVDRIPPQYKSLALDNGSAVTTINAFGVTPGGNGSFVRDIKLSSELNSDFATAIAIGSQVNGNQPGANATSFAQYNRGLQDRIIKEKLSAYNNISSSSGKNLRDVRNDMITFLYPTYSKMQYNAESLTGFESKNKTYAQMLVGELANTGNISPPFFLPFNLKLTLDGISGIKLFQKFKVSDNVLPPTYTAEQVDLLVKEVNHNISADGWTTEIGTLSAPAIAVGEKADNAIKSFVSYEKALFDKLFAISNALDDDNSLNTVKSVQTVGGSGTAYGGASSFLPAANATADLKVWPWRVKDPEGYIDANFQQTAPAWMPYHKESLAAEGLKVVITSPMQSARFSGKEVHTGMDVAASQSETVNLIAPIGGKVKNKFESATGGFGPNYPQIRPPGKLLIQDGAPGGTMMSYQVWMGHTSKFIGEDNRTVVAGDVVAWQGNEGRSGGPHLHLEIYLPVPSGSPLREKQQRWAVDPAAWLDRTPIPSNAARLITGTGPNMKGSNRAKYA